MNHHQYSLGCREPAGVQAATLRQELELVLERHRTQLRAYDRLGTSMRISKRSA